MRTLTAIHHKSDFDFILMLKDCEGVEGAFPPYDFEGEIWPERACRLKEELGCDQGRLGEYMRRQEAWPYRFGRKNGTLTNCVEDSESGGLRVVVDNHQLPPGRLRLIIRMELPEAVYPDGNRLVVQEHPLDIELMHGPGSGCEIPDVRFVMPYAVLTAYEMAKAKGYKGTEEQFVEELCKIAETRQNVENIKEDLNGRAKVIIINREFDLVPNGPSHQIGFIFSTGIKVTPQGKMGDERHYNEVSLSIDDEVVAKKKDLNTLKTTVEAMKERAVGILLEDGQVMELNDGKGLTIGLMPPLRAQGGDNLMLEGQEGKLLVLGFDEGKLALTGTVSKALTDIGLLKEQLKDTIRSIEIDSNIGNAELNSERSLIVLGDGLNAGNINKYSIGIGVDLAVIATKRDLEALKRDILGDDLDETFNTLVQVQEWANEHGTEYADLVAEVGKKADREKTVYYIVINGQHSLIPNSNNTVNIRFGKGFESVGNSESSCTINLDEEYVATQTDLKEAKFALFDDEWEALGGTIIDKVKHIYGLNGLTDITYEQALAIKAAGPFTLPNPHVFVSGIRTNLVYGLNEAATARDRIDLSFKNLFRQNTTIEVVNLKGRDDFPVSPMEINDMFQDCYSLREVIGIINISRIGANVRFCHGCSALVTIKLHSVKTNLNLAGAPLLSLESFQFLIEKAANTAAITVTVHGDVYAKLTDEGNAEWNKVLTDALAKNISFATT